MDAIILLPRGGERIAAGASIILAANARAYIGGLTDYRHGDVIAWCSLFATATRTASEKASDVTRSLQNLRHIWFARAGKPRRDSAAAKLLTVLPAYPIVDVSTIRDITGTSEQAARLAVLSLEQAHILRPFHVRRRGRTWEATEVFDVINAFEWEISTPDDLTERRRASPADPRDDTD